MLQTECEAFEIIDWDEDTNEIIHAVCTDHNPCWPNCNLCMGVAEYADIQDDAVCKLCSSQAANHNSGLCDGCEEIKACEGCPYGGSPNEGCPMYCSVWAKSEFAK